MSPDLSPDLVKRETGLVNRETGLVKCEADLVKRDMGCRLCQNTMCKNCMFKYT